MLSIQTRAVDRAGRICAMACAFGLLSAPTFAQDPSNQPDRCQALQRQQDPNANVDIKSDTKKPADCNGVLKPPSTGDSDFVVPAPQIGDTPVIPPGAIPHKQQ
jgi:hypothetical protein